jgi:hypothetical protein
MDQESRKRFNEIVAKEANALSAGDIAFLRARRDYLTADQEEEFADVLEPSAAEKPLEEYTEKALAKLAKSLDIDPKDFDDNEQLIAAIREKQSVQ